MKAARFLDDWLISLDLCMEKLIHQINIQAECSTMETILKTIFSGTEIDVNNERNVNCFRYLIRSKYTY